jgi:hypothetical protein
VNTPLRNQKIHQNPKPHLALRPPLLHPALPPLLRSLSRHESNTHELLPGVHPHLQQKLRRLVHRDTSIDPQEGRREKGAPERGAGRDRPAAELAGMHGGGGGDGGVEGHVDLFDG